MLLSVLVQVHIPKCAGTSVAAWLLQASETGTLSGFGSFYSDFVFDDDSLWQAGLHDLRLSAVSAHNIRRFAPEIHGRQMLYFTILRHPLAHFLSIVRYMLQEREAFEVPPDVPDTSRAVTAWLLERPPGSLFRENTQTNHLALYPWCDATFGRCDPDHVERWAPADRAAFERERLDLAKHVLRSFVTVGAVERLTDTLTVLRRRSALHGLDLLPVEDVPHDNVTRVPLDDISWIEHEPLGRRLLESLADDWELYVYALELLDEAREQDAMASEQAL